MGTILLLSLLRLAGRSRYCSTTMALSVSASFSSSRSSSSDLVRITKCILERIIVKVEEAVTVINVLLVFAIFVDIVSANCVLSKFLIHEVVR